jgi:hypothetical protein
MQFRDMFPVGALIILSSLVAGASCNPGFVQQTGRTLTVLPNHSDDTENLQCAFDLGTQKPGTIIQLLNGTYITGRIKVDGFVGMLRGMGMNATTIRNPDSPIYVTPDDFYMISPESDAFQPPYLFVFLGGDYTVSDLTVSIVGSEPATDWSIFGIRNWLGHGITSLGGPFTILGSPTDQGHHEANATFRRVRLAGEVTNDPLFGYNIYNAILPQGFAAPTLEPLSGRFTVIDSIFENLASATPLLNLQESWVSISGNVFNNVYVASEVVDVKNTLYEFAHNQVRGSSGVAMYDDCLGSDANCGLEDSQLMVKANSFEGVDGVLIDGTFSGGTKALVLVNDFTGVTGTAVRLGENTTKCLVVLTGAATVDNLGTDNKVVGPARADGNHRKPIRSLPKLGPKR